MYNKPLRFDGDIIITDPCYIMQKGEDNQFVQSLHLPEVQEPQYEDYFSYPIGLKGNGRVPIPTDYPDCIKVDYKDPRVCSNYIYGDLIDYIDDLIDKIGKEEDEDKLKSAQGLLGVKSPDDVKQWQSFLSKIKKFSYSPTHAAEHAAYMHAFEEWAVNVAPKRDWAYCECGTAMEKLGFTTYLADSTIWGDWSCSVVQVGVDFEPISTIGEFCADSGMVGVFLLDEVLAYNPEFNYHIERLWTTTLVKDFHGWVQLKNEENEVSVVGSGSINFKSIQTGF